MSALAMALALLGVIPSAAPSLPFPGGVAAALADEPSIPPTQPSLNPVPVPELTTSDSNTVLQPDGSYTTTAYPEPVNYLDDDGTWHQIDNTLVDAPGAAYDVQNAANSFTTQIPQDPATTPIKVAQDDAWVSMRMHGLGDAAASVHGATASFDDVTHASSVDYQATGTVLKESIHLDAAPTSPVSYTYSVNASTGLIPSIAADGSVDFKDPNGNVAFVMPAGVMYDSAESPATSDGVAYSLAASGSQWTLTVTPDMNWLTAAARTYPVTIDPSLGPEDDVRDCYLASQNPDASHCGSGQTDLPVGITSGGLKYRGLVGFDVSSIPATATVNSASVDLWLKSATNPGNSTNYEIYSASHSFSNAATWNDSACCGTWNGGGPGTPASDPKSMDGSITGAYKTFTGLAPMIQRWVNNDEKYHTGMVVKQVTENSSNPNVLSFATNVTGHDPRLTVSYTEAADPAVSQAGDRSFWTYESRQLTDKVTAKVNVGNGNLLLESDDAKLDGVAGWDLALTRYYNSASYASGVGQLGQGWTTGLGGSVRLEFPNANNSRVFFYGPSGYRAQFEKYDDNTYNSHKGTGIDADLQLIVNGDADGDGLNGGDSDDQYKLKWFDKSFYLFNAAGQLTKTQDANGNALNFSYNTDGSLAKVTDTRGRQLVMGYTSGLLTTASFEDASGNLLLRWAYTYKANTTPALLETARLDAVSSNIGATVASNDPNLGAVTTYGYDANGRLDSIKDAREGNNGGTAGGTTTFTYNNGQVATIDRQTDDPTIPDSITGFTYYTTADGGGTSDTCTNADVTNRNATSRTTVDGERTDVDDTTRYCVDVQGRVVRARDAQGVKRSVTYTENSHIATADMAGLGDGQAQYTMSYDSDDNLVDQTSPAGREDMAEYDDSTNPHQATTTSADDGTSGAYVYDNNGNLLQAVSGAGIDYRYCWTDQGQIKRIDPVTATGTASSSTTISASNHSISGCDSTTQGNDTLYTYNAKNELQSVDRPSGGDESFTYDALSRLATVTDARGVTTSYTYDGLDRVVSVSYSQSGQPTTTVNYTYDLDGNLTRIDDLNGTNTFSYDELNRKTSDSAQAPSGPTNYSYDPAGDLTQVAVTGQTSTTNYSYDNLDRVQTVSDSRLGSNPITFNYDNHDKRTQTVYPVPGSNNDIVQEARYDNDGDMTCVYSYRQNAAPTNGATDCPSETNANLITYQGYNYKNGAGATTSKVYTLTELGGRTTKYNYDGAGRLSQATTRVTSDTSSQVLRQFNYTYDRHSNLTERQTTGTTPGLATNTRWQTYTTGDELCATELAATDPSLTCSSSGTGIDLVNHDPAGNLTTITGSGAFAGTSLTYNQPGQTTAMQAPGMSSADTMAYDGVMQDRRTQAGATSMAYGYAGLTAESNTGTSPHSEDFIRDPNGNLLAMVNILDGSVRYYLTDDQKSVIATVDNTGSNVIRYLYEPYGKLIRSWVDPNAGTSTDDGAENANLSAPANDYNPWRYASGYQDASTGFVKFGTRYYMPQFATWTQPDPKDGKLASPASVNRYGYAGADPVNMTDFDGRDWWDPTSWDWSDIGWGSLDILSGVADIGLGVTVAAYTSETVIGPVTAFFIIVGGVTEVLIGYADIREGVSQ